MSIIFSDVDVSSVKNLNQSETEQILHATINSNAADELGLPLPNKLKQTKWCVAPSFLQYADRIANFKVRPDDIWVVGFPKSGTTWVHNIVWQLRNDLDFSSPSIGPEDYAMELPTYQTFLNETYFDELDKLPSPRIFKSHLPVYLLPKEVWTVRPKIIYTSRNPKDIAVSLGHFFNAFNETNEPIEHFLELCLNDMFVMCPMHDHVLSFWELRNLDHVLFTKYEDILADPFGNVKRMSDFLERTLSDQDIKDLVEYLSFENMKSKIRTPRNNGTQESTGFSFCRKGKAGGYRDEMSDEYTKRFDEWTEDRLKDSDFTYASV